MGLTRRGRGFAIVALLFLGSSLSSDTKPLRVLGAAALALVFVDLLFLPRGLKGIDLRVGPRRTIAGRRFVEKLRVDLTPGAPAAKAPLRLTEAGSQCGGSACLVEVDAKSGGALIELDCRFRERGVFAERAFRLTATSPFGFFVRHRELRVQREVVVEPARLSVDEALSLFLDAHFVDVSRRAFERRGTEYWSLRELEPFGDLRRVHAARSAAARRLLVRELRRTEVQAVEVVLDLRAKDATMTQHARFELALRFAASFADRALRTDGDELLVSACIVGRGSVERFDLASPSAAADYLRCLAGATCAPVVPLDASVLRYFERRSRARFILVEAGVEDPDLVARIGDPLRPLHVAPQRAPSRSSAAVSSTSASSTAPAP